MGRIVSLDYGLKRIGVALSDERKIIASSLGHIETGKNAEETMQKLLHFLSPHHVESLIIGFPLHLNGKEGWIADEVRHFAALLQKKVSFPVILWDERLSTLQADRALREANLTRKKRSKLVDGVAAVILLQSYLEHLSLKAELI